MVSFILPGTRPKTEAGILCVVVVEQTAGLKVWLDPRQNRRVELSYMGYHTETASLFPHIHLCFLIYSACYVGCADVLWAVWKAASEVVPAIGFPGPRQWGCREQPSLSHWRRTADVSPCWGRSDQDWSRSEWSVFPLNASAQTANVQKGRGILKSVNASEEQTVQWDRYDTCLGSVSSHKQIFSSVHHNFYTHYLDLFSSSIKLFSSICQAGAAHLLSHDLPAPIKVECDL